MLQQHLDLVAGLEVGHVLEFFEGNRALGLEADVEHHDVVADALHFRFDDLAFVDGRERPLI